MEENINIKNEEYVDSKCPNCGSELKFLPGTKKIKCVSCDSEFEIESLGSGKLDSEEVNYAETLAKLKSQSTMVYKQRTIHCQDCGGLIYLNERTVSIQCPFCGSNRVVEENKDEELIKINGVIPFVIEEKQVKDLFSKWIKKRPLAPRKFKKGKVLPSFGAFYIPFYTFDSKTVSHYTGFRGDYYYVTKTVRTKNGTTTIRERRTSWKFRSGTINLNFDDVLVDGSNNSLHKYIQKIACFDFSVMEKYQEKFLLGYYTEKPSVSLESGFNGAKQVMSNAIKQACIKDIGGDTYRDLKFSTNYSDVTFKQIMAPVYNGHYTYLNKRYNFICNGQNGQFAGSCPISKIKVSILVTLGILFLIFIIYLVITSM